MKTAKVKKSPKFLPCPICGKVPEIDFSEDDSWSPSRKTFGRKAIAFTTGHSRCKISASGSAILWANYNRAMMYTSEDWYATQDRAEAICIRNWNKAVNRWNRENARSPCHEEIRTPTLNDSNIRAIIGAHPKELFEAMKEFEPYILIRAGATGLEIKLRNSYTDLENLEETFKRLNHLGYHPEAHSSTCTMPNGERVINLDRITIDWKERRDPGLCD